MALAIIIPTYEREHVIEEFLDEFLKLGALDREKLAIYIVDNASSNLRYGFLSQLANANSEIKYLKFDEKLVAHENYIRSLLVVEADYAVFCTDKDKLNTSVLLELHDMLHTLMPNFSCIFVNNSVQSHSRFKCSSYEMLFRRGFTCPHPTGYVFDIARFREFINNCPEWARRNNCFLFDIFYYDGLQRFSDHWDLGRALYIAEPPSEIVRIPSFSYTSPDTYYFSAKQRTKIAKIFLQYVSSTSPRWSIFSMLTSILICYRYIAVMKIWLPSALSDKNFVVHYQVSDTKSLFSLQGEPSLFTARPVTFTLARLIFVLRYWR